MTKKEDFPENAILRKRGDMSTYHWVAIIIHYVIPRIIEFQDEGIIPTIRGMFYFLTDSQIVSKLAKTYKKFDKALVDARKKRPSQGGYIPIGTFSDNTRRIIDINDKYVTLEEQIEYLMRRLTNLSDTFKDSIPRWLGQPNYVEVWIEKDAMTGTIYSILKDSKVRIAPNRGWGSLEFLHKNIERLEDQLERSNGGQFEGITDIWILYVGDFDPSGLRMDERYERELNNLDSRLKKSGRYVHEVNVHFKRIALTWDQIQEFKLEHLKNAILSAEEQKRLEDDPNSEWFKRQYGSLFQIQSDSLQALQPRKFKELMINEVNNLFDEDIREEVLTRPVHSLSHVEIWEKIKNIWTYHAMLNDSENEEEGVAP